MSKVSQTINGTFGRVWVNDEDYGMVRSFEAKATLDWEAITEPEKLSPGYKYKGYAIDGTMVGMQIDSRFAKLYAEGITTGNIPDVDVVGRVADPQAAGQVRVAFHGVVFDELTLLKFENNTIVEEEVPFKAQSYEYLDQI